MNYDIEKTLIFSQAIDIALNYICDINKDVVIYGSNLYQSHPAKDSYCLEIRINRRYENIVKKYIKDILDLECNGKRELKYGIDMLLYSLTKAQLINLEVLLRIKGILYGK